MKKIVMTIAMMALLSLTACKQTTKTGRTETEVSNGDKISQSLTDKNGNELQMEFNNAKDIVTVKYKGEMAELEGKRPASGIWYANEQYELRGKGNDITLKKDGKILFEHQDDIVPIRSKDDKGNVLDLTFNNTQGTLKAYLNGGEEINMQEQPSGSGYWYKNEQYELRGKGNDITLKKDGKILFEH